MIKFKLLHERAVAPERMTIGASGFDLVCLDDENRILWPGVVERFPTGIAFEIPPGWEGQVRSRSGLARQGIVVPGGIGTIDSDYRGEVVVHLVNLTARSHSVVRPGDRIAQIVFAPVWTEGLWPVGTLSQTERGSGGEGSTGR